MRSGVEQSTVNQVVSRFWASYRLELRQIVTSPGYILLNIAWGGFLIANSLRGGQLHPYLTAQQFMLSGLGSGYVGMISLIALFMAGISASRAARARFEVLEAAFPTGSEVPTARLLALLTAVCAFLVVPLLLAVWAGPVDKFLVNLPLFLFEAVLSLAFVIAIIWLVGVTYGIRRYMYPLFACAWLASIVLPGSMVNTPSANLLRFFRSTGGYAEIWGRTAQGELPTLFNLFYVGVVLALLSGIVWLYAARRAHLRVIPAAGVTLTATAFALLIGSRYTEAIQNARSDFYRQDISPQVDYSLPGDAAYHPTAYTIHADLRDMPRFTVTMDVTGDTPFSVLEFTLYDALTITKSNVPYERDGHFVRFNFDAPVQKATLQLEYEGNMWRSGYFVVGQPPEGQDFVQEGGVNLSCAAAWYPIPGRILIGRLGLQNFNEFGYAMGFSSRYTPDCILAEPARFTLSADYNGELASNLEQTGVGQFASASATWLHLLGSQNLVTDQVEDVVFTTAQTQHAYVRGKVEQYYIPVLAHLRTFFPDVHGIRVFVVDDGVFGMMFQPLAMPMLDGDLVAHVTPTRLDYFEQNSNEAYHSMGQQLTDSLFGYGNHPLSENIGYFLWAHYISDGDVERMRDVMQNGIPQGGWGIRSYYGTTPADHYPVAQALFDIYSKRGEAGTRAVLNRLRTHFSVLATLQDQDVVRWLERTSDVF
jgi:hypothetical protein